MQDYRINVMIVAGQCTRCDTPLVRRRHCVDPALCRPCLRALDADVGAKKQILFPAPDPAGELLSTFA